MSTFVLIPETQLVREMEVHEAAKEMARRLGISGQIETRVGDFRESDPQRRGVNVTPSDKRLASNIFYPFTDPAVPRSEDGWTPQVLVMNSNGATVAKYLL